jgi:hypothetical protein
VSTDEYGHFVISGPPTEYVLQISDPNYNTTYLTIALSPGETTSVGTVFLSAFGTATGHVYDESTFAPLAGAAVYGCARFSEGTCAPLQVTDSSGAYTFSAAPGPYTVEVSAQDYQTADGLVTIQAGLTEAVAPILLTPIGGNSGISVSGTVVTSTDGTPIVGAVVTALVPPNDTVSAAAAVTQRGGTYQLTVPHGSYELEAVATGYRPEQVSIQAVSGPLTELFELTPMTYQVHGQVVDGLTNEPIGGAIIWSTYTTNGQVKALANLTKTSPEGMYTLSLTNGTHVLEATGPSPYATVPFTVDVNGVSLNQNVTMTPALVTVHGRVVDGVTGLPLTGATVTISGEVEPGVRYDRSFTTGSSGAFTTTVYAGEYEVSTSYGSYHPLQQSFNASYPTTALTLRLTPLAGSAATVAPISGWFLGAAAGIGAVSVALVAVGLSRLWPRSRAAPANSQTARRGGYAEP